MVRQTRINMGVVPGYDPADEEELGFRMLVLSGPTLRVETYDGGHKLLGTQVLTQWPPEFDNALDALDKVIRTHIRPLVQD